MLNTLRVALALAQESNATSAMTRIERVCAWSRLVAIRSSMLAATTSARNQHGDRDAEEHDQPVASTHRTTESIVMANPTAEIVTDTAK